MANNVSNLWPRHFQEEAKKTLYYFWRTILQHGSDKLIEAKAEEFEDCERISLSAYDNLLRRFPTHVVCHTRTIHMDAHKSDSLITQRMQ